MAEVREAVRIVIDRLKTNPEDFIHPGKFTWLTAVMMKDGRIPIDELGLNDTEESELAKAFDAMMYERFHNRVLASLLADESNPNPLNKQYQKYQIDMLQAAMQNTAMQHPYGQYNQQALLNSNKYNP